MADYSQGGACVVCCGSKICNTCDPVFVSRPFTSNVTSKSYIVRSTSKSMNCGSKNVIHLISCRKCAVQYAAKTSQSMRCQFRNQR